MAQKLSKWFPGSENPWEPGQYQLRLSFREYGRRQHTEVFWDGERWVRFFDGYGFSVLLFQPNNLGWHFEWRGLAKKP